MEVFLQLNDFKIKAQSGDYNISFSKINDFNKYNIDTEFCIIDKKVFELYKNTDFFKSIQNPIFVDALEPNKTIDTSVRIIEELLTKGITRGKKITAIGGGITQDIATFVCSILFRGVKWTLIPTTLLAQCDSCIGGKSSLNFKSWKNMIGNFYPPEQIIISSDFLETLEDKDIRSGIGEMIKVHMLTSAEQVNQIHHYLKNIKDTSTITEATYNSLFLKKSVIEEDEFDTGLRLKMNLGHTFGHALEVATNYEIPHGLAVNIGLHMANYFSIQTKNISEKDYQDLTHIIDLNLKDSDYKSVNLDAFFQALRKDKKNKEGQYCFIIPTENGNVERKYFPIDENTDEIISTYFSEIYKV